MESFPNLDQLIDMALYEDLQDSGDITSASIFQDQEHTFRLISKDDGILCGTGIFKKVLQRADKSITVSLFFSDGTAISSGDLVAEVSGRVRSVLSAERTALNFISMLSAVATRTHNFVSATEGKAIILDTRKTIPGFRHLQKYAVRCGGGKNHRMGLHDMIMIKDNHIDAAGGIGRAIKRARNKWKDQYLIEVETRNLDEVKEALKYKANRIMLDNMSIGQMSEAVELIDGACETEASGNITREKIEAVITTGVDFISAGELTNSITAFDFSLKNI